MGARSYFLLDDQITSNDGMVSENASEINSGNLLLAEVRVLVVDDNPINLSVADKTLSKFGASIHKSYSAKDGLKKFVANEVDIILMDLHMPLIDGFEATRLIKQTQEFKQRPIPIIAYTTYTFAEVKEAIEKYGLDGYIGKPFTQAQVVDTILGVLK